MDLTISHLTPEEMNDLALDMGTVRMSWWSEEEAKASGVPYHLGFLNFSPLWEETDEHFRIRLMSLTPRPASDIVEG